MIKVELLGELGNKFGSIHVLNIKSPAEAIRALNANFKDFRSYMENSGKNGVAYRLLNNNQDISLDDINHPASKSIKIVPVMIGAGGNGLFNVVLGAALIAASIYMPTTAFAWSSIGAFDAVAIASTAAGYIGTSMVISGVSQMLSPMPKAPNYGSEERSPSYLFNGAVNTTAQGHPVPVGYGRLIIGSAVISAGTDTVAIKA